MKYIIAHDYGTSALKSVLFTTEGDFVRQCNISYPTYRDYPSWAEQDPEDWWNAFCQANKTLLDGMENIDIACVSFCGTYPNLICVDKNGKSIGRAMIWQDSRAGEEAMEISKKMSPEYAGQYRNNLMTTDRTLPKLMWLRKNEPERYARIDKIMPCVSQFVIFKLTGNAVADFRTGFSTGFTNIERNAWSDYMIGLTDIPKSILPQLHNRTEIVGAVPASKADECGLKSGTKIVVGTGDGDSADVGMGMLKDGDAYLNGSTSASFLVVNKKVKGSWPYPTSCSGASITWMKNVLCAEERLIAEQTGRDVYDVINERIASAPVGSHGVTFLPYLSGERGVRYNDKAKGSFTGISLNTTHEDMLRAVYEGIGMNLSCVLQVARDAGYTFDRMPMVGGMAKSAVMRQIFSDIFGIELYTVNHADAAGAVGAAVLGGIAVGIYQDERAQKLFMRPIDTTKPNMDHHRKYQSMLAMFEKQYQAQCPLYEEM